MFLCLKGNSILRVYLFGVLYLFIYSTNLKHNMFSNNISLLVVPFISTFFLIVVFIVCLSVMDFGCLHVFFSCLPEGQTHGLCGWCQGEAVDPETLQPFPRTQRCDDVET